MIPRCVPSSGGWALTHQMHCFLICFNSESRYFLLQLLDHHTLILIIASALDFVNVQLHCKVGVWVNLPRAKNWIQHWKLFVCVIWPNAKHWIKYWDFATYWFPPWVESRLCPERESKFSSNGSSNDTIVSCTRNNIRSAVTLAVESVSLPSETFFLGQYFSLVFDNTMFCWVHSSIFGYNLGQIVSIVDWLPEGILCSLIGGIQSRNRSQVNTMQ